MPSCVLLGSYTKYLLWANSSLIWLKFILLNVFVFTFWQENDDETNAREGLKHSLAAPVAPAVARVILMSERESVLTLFSFEDDS